MVSVLDSGAEGPGFKSQSRRCRVTVLNKLFTPIVHHAAKLVAALLRVARVTAGLGKVMAAYRRVYNSRHLQADCQELGSAPEPYARYSSMGYLFNHKIFLLGLVSAPLAAPPGAIALLCPSP